MLDSESRRASAASPTIQSTLEFFVIELSPLADGTAFVSVTAVTVDDEEPQLLNQEIASERVATIDEALALVSERVRANTKVLPRREESNREQR
jgi:hypothetical protein